VKAEVKDGVLTVNIPKKQASITTAPKG